MVTVSAKVCPRQRCTQHTTIATSSAMRHGNVGAAKLANLPLVGSERIVPLNSFVGQFPGKQVPTTFPTEPRRGCRSSGITPKWEGANIGHTW